MCVCVCVFNNFATFYKNFLIFKINVVISF